MVSQPESTKILTTVYQEEIIFGDAPHQDSEKVDRISDALDLLPC